MEEGVDPGGLENAAGGLEGPGVAGQVLPGAELEGVDEDAGDHPVARLARGLDKAHMAGVERPHRGHEADPASLGVPVARELLELGDGFYELPPWGLAGGGGRAEQAH